MGLKRKYLEVTIPEVFAVLVPDPELPGGWIEFGVYEKEGFDIAEYGPKNVLVNTTNGSPFYLRVVKIDGFVWTCHDGGGDPYQIQVVPYDEYKAAVASFSAIED